MGSSNPYDDAQAWLPEQGGMSGAPYSDPAYYASAQQQTLVSYPTDDKRDSEIIARAQTAPQSSQGPWQNRQGNRGGNKARMPKERAVAMARAWKKSIVVASIAVFGVLSGLVATHLQSTTTGQSTSASASQNTSSSSNSSATSSSTASGSGANQNTSGVNSGSFFNQQGGGYGFGNSGSSQPPVSSSHVSPSR